MNKACIGEEVCPPTRCDWSMLQNLVPAHAQEGGYPVAC
jgi:hypothetical protein